MHVKGQRSIILRSSNQRRWSKNRKGESARNSRVAGAEECKKYAEVFGVSKLLQIVC